MVVMIIVVVFQAKVGKKFNYKSLFNYKNPESKLYGQCKINNLKVLSK